MEYKRLTKREENGTVSISCELTEVIQRLAVLEDMIDDGTLIERYFIQEDELPNGKVWYNVCELNENYGSIKKQCATRREAEAILAELRGNA